MKAQTRQDFAGPARRVDHAEGRRSISDGPLAGQVRENVDASANVLFEAARADGRQKLVGMTVRGDFVAGQMNFAYEIGKGFGHSGQNEEGRLDVMPLEDLKQTLGVFDDARADGLLGADDRDGPVLEIDRQGIDRFPIRRCRGIAEFREFSREQVGKKSRSRRSELERCHEGTTNNIGRKGKKGEKVRRVRRRRRQGVLGGVCWAALPNPSM